MDQSAFFGLLHSEANARQSLAEELLEILQESGVIDPALEDARLHGGEEMNQLLFGRSDYLPVLIPATKFGALRQLVSGRSRILPEADLLRPFVPPVELLAPPPVPEQEEKPDLADYRAPDADAAPASLPAKEKEPSSLLVLDNSDTPPAAIPDDPEPEPAAPAPAVAPIPLPPPPSDEETPMPEISQFANLSPPFSPAADPSAPSDSQEQVVTAKFLQKVSTLVHSAMANRDTYSDAVAEALSLPAAEMDGLLSGKGQNVTLGTVVRVMLYLGAPNLSLGIPAPRQQQTGR